MESYINIGFKGEGVTLEAENIEVKHLHKSVYVLAQFVRDCGISSNDAINLILMDYNNTCGSPEVRQVGHEKNDGK